jgi:hypothetical protein
VQIPDAINATDITPDGAIVVGTGVNPVSSNSEAYFWRWKIDPAPTFLGVAQAAGVSNDGTVIVGTIFDPGVGADVAARWTQTTGWQSIGWLPNAQNCPSRSEATDVSGDGRLIVGFSNDGCTERAFVWSASAGMTQLEAMGAGHNRALVIAGNGSRIGGFGQGISGNTPAFWDPTNPLSGGDMIHASLDGEVMGMSEHGTILVGRSGNAAFTCVPATGTWDTDIVEWGSDVAVDVSTDGARMLGYTSSWPFGGAAWLNFSYLSHYWLLNNGFPNPPYLGPPREMTPDGSVMVGDTEFGGAWIVVLPVASAKVNPVAGNCVENPGSMVVTGTPTLGGLVTLGLHNPVGSQPIGTNTLLLVSLRPDEAPFWCGTMVPGLGMNPGPGPLWVDLGGGFLGAFRGPTWNGTPVNISLAIPTDPAVIGLVLVAQGALLPPAFPGKSALTDAAVIRIGLY